MFFSFSFPFWGFTYYSKDSKDAHTRRHVSPLECANEFTHMYIVGAGYRGGPIVRMAETDVTSETSWPPQWRSLAGDELVGCTGINLDY